MAVVPTIGWLFVGQAIAGASYVSASALIADVTPPEQRAQRFGLLSADWACGFVFGPVLLTPRIGENRTIMIHYARAILGYAGYAFATG